AGRGRGSPRPRHPLGQYAAGAAHRADGEGADRGEAAHAGAPAHQTAGRGDERVRIRRYLSLLLVSAGLRGALRGVGAERAAAGLPRRGMKPITRLAALLFFLALALPLHAQGGGSEWDAQSPQLTRPELEQMLARFEETAASAAYSGAIR